MAAVRTTNIRNVWSAEVTEIDNGAFVLEVRYGIGEERAPGRLVLHFSSFWMVTTLAKGLWRVVTRRREQLASEIKAAENHLKGEG